VAAPLTAFVFMGFCWGGFAALVPELKAGIGASDRGFGFAMLIAAFGAVTAMWVAPLAERRLGTLALPVGAVAMTLAFLTPGLAGGVVSFGLAMALASVASGMLDVVMNAAVARIEAARRRPLMGFAHAMFSFGYAASAMTTGLVRSAGGGAAEVFGGIAVLSLLALPLLARGAPPPEPAGVGGSTAFGPGLRRVVVLAGLIVLAAFLVEQAADNWAALHLERTLGAGAALGAAGPAVLGLTMGAGRMAAQGLVARAGARTVMAWGALLAAVGAALAGAASVLALAYGGLLALGLGISVLAPMGLAVAGETASDANRSAVIARVAVIGYGGFFLGPPVMGFLSEGWGLPAAFLALAILLAMVRFILVPALFARG